MANDYQMSSDIWNSLEEKLLSRIVKQEDGCWIWQGCKNACGYGQITWDCYRYKTHRIAWEIWRGPIPDGKWVLHKCDVPACCCPDHLFLGIAADNTWDMIEKGREGFRGKKPWAAVLTENEVREIRKLLAKCYSYREIGAIYGVNYNAIGAIKRGKNWAWLKDEEEETKQ